MGNTGKNREVATTGPQGEGARSASAFDRVLARLHADRYVVCLASLLVVFVAFNVTRNVFLGVHFDEANWLMQTRHLQAGYFLHPPFIVLELFAITRVLGESPLALRVGSIFFTTLSLVVVYLLALRIFKEKTWALLTTLLVAVLPITEYWLLIGHQDAPFVFFWLLAILMVWMAVSKGAKAYWYAAGVSAGLMLLCNLRSTMFFPGILLFLLTSAEGRRWFRRKEPYLAMLIVMLMFLPTFLWYASHRFEPITYQISNRPGFLQNGFVAFVTSIVKHAGWEAMALSVFVYMFSFFGIFYAGYKGLVKKDQRYLLLFWLSAPTVVFFSITGGTPYWGLPGHFIALIAAVSGLREIVARTRSRAFKKYWRPVFAVTLLLVPLVSSLLYLYHYEYDSKVHNGWKQMAAKVDEVGKTMDDGAKPYIAAPYYYIPSEIYYYANRNDFAGFTVAFIVYEGEVKCGGSKYSPWVPLEKLKGKDFIFVDEMYNPDNYNTPVSFWEQKIPPYFERVDDPLIYHEVKKGKDYRTFYIFKCYGFKGPDKQMDVKGDVKAYMRLYPEPEASY